MKKDVQKLFWGIEDLTGGIQKVGLKVWRWETIATKGRAKQTIVKGRTRHCIDNLANHWKGL